MTNLRTPEESTLRVRGLPTAENRWSVQCLNCDSPLHGPFCSSCGQRAVPPHPTMKELAGDVFSELSGWDGKLAESFRTLLRRPGELTRQWIEGRRAAFISPLRLYLTASLVYFIIVAAAPNLRPAAQGSMNLDGLQVGITRDGKPSRVSELAATAIQTNKPLTGAERDSVLADIASAPAILRPMLRRAVDEPLAFTSAVRRAMPNVFLALVPVFGLILSLFYRGRHYPEHLYFAIHLAAFIFIARTLGNLALFTRNIPFAAVAQGAMILWIIAYGVIALRRVYGGSVPMTILKGIGVCLLYAAVAAPVVLGVALFVAS